MSTPYIGEIRLFAGNFAPVGWLLCQGQSLPISQYDVLFNLIGTTYGGDGQNTFNLPNLASRLPVHAGTGGGSTYTLGQMAGEEQVTLTTQQLPQHTHTPAASTSNQGPTSPTNNFWAASPQYTEYFATPDGTAMNPGAIPPVGGGQPHDNMVPFLAINFIIATEGVYPSPS